MANILVCDDDREIVDAIEIYLSQDGYQIFKAYDGEQAIEILKKEDIQLLIMDIMMPRLDGIRATLKIREYSSIPIIMLSAKSEDTDKILGLNIGADDYITKPFNPLEVVARVKTQLRRYVQYNHGGNSGEEAAHLTEEYDIRGLTINKNTHKCMLYGKEIALTPMEFSILWYLCEHRGSVISSEELFENVWGEKYIDNNNTVMAHIGRLREKLKEPARHPKFVKTVWGVGYTVE